MFPPGGPVEPPGTCLGDRDVGVETIGGVAMRWIPGHRERELLPCPDGEDRAMGVVGCVEACSAHDDRVRACDGEQCVPVPITDLSYPGQGCRVPEADAQVLLQL